LEECEHVLASQLLAQNRLLGGVHPVKLENVFRRIHANSANLFHGRPPLSEVYSDLILPRLMPSRTAHTTKIACYQTRAAPRLPPLTQRQQLSGMKPGFPRDQI